MNDDSKLIGVSVRAWLAILFSVTVCAMALGGMEVKEPLYTLAATACAFYFGQKNQNPSPRVNSPPASASNETSKE